jgi:hypothetical protein
MMEHGTLPLEFGILPQERAEPLGGNEGCAAGRGVQVVAIYRLLENAAFDPARVSVMVEGYNQPHGDRTDPVTELVAQTVVEIAQQQADLDPKLI